MSPPELVPLDEAAAAHGIGKRTLERWVAQGRLTPHKVRGERRTMLDRVELEAALLAANPKRLAATNPRRQRTSS